VVQLRSLPFDPYCFVDPKKHELAAMVADMWTAAMHALDAQLIQKYHPDEKDAAAFRDAMSKEAHNPTYQLYCYGFAPLINLRLTVRYLVTGRRPAST